MRTSSLETEKLLLSLGCAIRAEHELLPTECDPEKQILKSLKYYWTNNSIFFLIYTSLYERLFPYVHVDRLVKIAKNSILTNDEICLLTAICHNLSKKDQRFKSAVKKLSINLTKMNEPPKKELDKFLIKKWGEEPYLKRLGVSVRLFPLKKLSKLAPLKEVFEVNPWLKYRALFGSNTRSDCVFIIHNNTEELSASEVARRAYATRQAVSQYYNDLILASDSF